MSTGLQPEGPWRLAATFDGEAGLYARHAARPLTLECALCRGFDHANAEPCGHRSRRPYSLVTVSNATSERGRAVPTLSGLHSVRGVVNEPGKEPCSWNVNWLYSRSRPSPN